MGQQNLITKPAWHSETVAGCCGIGVIARLNSSSCSRGQRDANLKSWLDSPEPHDIGSDLPNWDKQSMHIIVESCARRPQGVLWGGRQGSAAWYGHALPSRLAYALPLEGMSKAKYAIYFMSDNMDDAGDVHIGPFTTRGFVGWLRNNELGALQASGPIKSLRTDHHIQGWLFTPNWDVCDKLIQQARTELIKLYKGYNNDPKIKQAQQDRCQAQAEATRTVQAALSSGWSGSTFRRLYAATSGRN